MTGSPARRATLVLLPLIALLAAGCVNLPSNTVVNSVSKQANTGSGSDVRIWPQGPKSTDQHAAIVEGFLQTAASDPSNHTIAQEYLTDNVKTTWDSSKVIVFSEESSVTPVPGQSDLLQISGTEVASVSDTGFYQPVQNPTRTTYRFHVVRDGKNGYRIDGLPSSGDFGIALTQETFRADYTAYYLYYLNEDATTQSMIPVPMYLRTQSSDAATAQNLATGLLKGPPDWLDGSAGLAAPQITLSGAGAVTIGQDDTASVSVTTPNYCTTKTKSACNRLADELLATFSTLGSINRVAVVDSKNDVLGSSTSVDNVMSEYHIGVSAAKAPAFYYLDYTTRHVFYFDGRGNATAAQLGPANRKYEQLAVTGYAGQTIAAAVEAGGTKLYLGAPGSPTAPVQAWSGQKISSLTWDALGHLWFLGTIGGMTSMYRIDITNGLQAQAQRMNVYGGDGGIVQEISAAPDGRRIAAVYTEPAGAAAPTYSLGIGVVEDTASQLSVNLSYGINQPVVYQWTNIIDMDWHGSQSLAVLGYPQTSSPLALYELNSDGSPVVSSTDYNAVTVNPPKGATGIEWTGSTLLVSYSTGLSGAAAEAIEQYSFTSGSWSALTGVQGKAPTYVDWHP